MSSVQEADYVVIGAGVMGAATAWALTGSGHNVVLLEQFEVGHKHGSSHGRSRIFRLSYPDPLHVELAQRAHALWRRIEQESGEPLLTTMGGFDLGRASSANAAALETMGARFEQLTSGQAGKRFPHIAFPDGEPVLYQPDAGIVAAERALAAFLRVATTRGADLHESERVVALEPRDGCVDVRTGRAVFRARVAIVTAGAWAAPLLESAGIRLDVEVTRETVGYYDVAGEAPLPLVEWGSPELYCLPSPGQGIKAAEHHAGPEVDPAEENQPSTRSLERVSAWVRERFPTAVPRPHLVETCLYTNTPDESFVLERHGRIVVGSPCSGHGFKFAPAIGTQLASLAEGVAG